MRLRPLNDTVVIEPDGELIPIDFNQDVLDAINKSKLIILPEKNMLMKLSNKAKVISYGPLCNYKFKEDQDIIYNQFAGTPYWWLNSTKRLRLIKFHDIIAVYE